MRTLVPGEILRPGKILGSSELAGGVSSIGNQTELYSVCPSVHVGGERDDIEFAHRPGTFEHAAPVADHRDAQRGVPGWIGIRQVGIHQALQPLCEPLPVWREGDAHASGIGVHPGPMAFPGEHHAVIDADGREDSPAVEQSDLPRREVLGTRIANLVVVEQIAVHKAYYPFYPADGDLNRPKGAGRPSARSYAGGDGPEI